MKQFSLSFFAYVLFAGFLFGVVSVPRASAAQLLFQTSSAVVHQGQQIAVDILLDTKGENVNTVGITVGLPEHLTFVSSDDSHSIIGLWVDEPIVSADGRKLTFSGIIPNGFSGLIDPFSPDKRAPGTLIRLLFTGRNVGVATSSLVDVEAYLNDGEGTETHAISKSLSLVVDELLGWLPVETPDDVTPPLPFTPVLVRDFLLFDGKYALIFNTKDKESGISYYEVKEGAGPWKQALSPYVLTDQKISAEVQVKAVDRSGNERIEILPAKKHLLGSRTIGLGVSVLSLIVCCFVIMRKRSIKDELSA